MLRGRFIAAILAVVASCVSFTAHGQSAAVNSGSGGLTFALNLGLPDVEPIATPGAAPIAPPGAAPLATPPGTLAVSPTASSAAPPSGLPGETPWFQRFLLPVPEATESVDDWLSCSKPGVMGNLDYLNWSARRSGLDYASFVSATVPTALPTASRVAGF